MITVVLKSALSSTNQIISSVASQLHPGMDAVMAETSSAIEVDGDAFRMDNMNLVVSKEGADVALFAQGTWLFACPSDSYQNMTNPGGA
jgi:hypothetical protein